jgi:beta-lactamase regulating signal transducer with metallopeptidase domain
MLCFLYVIALTAALGLVASLTETLLPTRAPRRWLWCGAIALSLTIPPFYQALHKVQVHGTLAGIAAYDGVLMTAWSRVSLGLLLWGLASVGLVAHAVYRARRQRERVTAVDGVSVVVTDRLGPATTGFWRAHVLVPQWVLGLPQSQRRYVLQHEEEHRRAHDARMLTIASLAVIVIPWNVAMWWLQRRLALAVEVDCDARVVTRLGDVDRYSELLLQVAAAGPRGPRLQPGFIGGAGMLERRLKAMLRPRRLSAPLRVFLLLAAVALLATVLALPHPVLGTH